MNSTNDMFDSGAPDTYQIKTRATGPAGSLPITEDMLLHSPSGDLFGMTQNAGMGWNPAEVGRKQFLILSTQGGLRAPVVSRSSGARLDSPASRARRPC